REGTEHETNDERGNRGKALKVFQRRNFFVTHPKLFAGNRAVLSAGSNSRTDCQTEGRELRVVWGDSEVGGQKRLAARLIASAVGLDSDEYRVNLRKCFGIFRLQNPTFLRRVVFVKNAEINRLLKVGAATSPRLKCRGMILTLLLIEVVGVKNQRLLF